MTRVAQSVSYLPHTLESQHGDKMNEAVPDPIAKAIAEEMERAKAAAEWRALVATCAARGDE